MEASAPCAPSRFRLAKYFSTLRPWFVEWLAPHASSSLAFHCVEVTGVGEVRPDGPSRRQRRLSLDPAAGNNLVGRALLAEAV